MSELPNPNNNFRATLDYDLSLTNLNAIFGGMWDALQPYRDVVVQADEAINALNARTLQVIGDSITPELDQLRASTAEAQEAVDDLIGNNFAEDLAGKLTKDQNLDDLPDKGAARTALELKPVATKDFATEAEAEAGENDDKPMTPLRTAQAIAVLGGFADYQEFLTSGTWTKPAGAKWVYVEAIGGGGAGVGYSGQRAGGGGGGGFNSGLFLADTLAATEVVTIGSGGSPQGNDGGASSFGAVTAPGGEAGYSNRGGASGGGTKASQGGYAGGGGGGEDTGTSGGNAVKGGAGGGCAYTTSGGLANNGGQSIDGGNGGGAGHGTNGENGNAPGGGGGASRGGVGGVGASGRVRVWAW